MQTVRSPLLALLFWSSMLASGLRCQEVPPAQRPNIVFVFSDDHACNAISAYGSELVQTPNIDRLANEGILFRNSFCANSLCGPSRATVLTGKHSAINGFRQNGDRFDGTQTTFPQLLQAAGYSTAIIGKWHLKSDPTGFDHWDVLPGQGAYYNPDFLSPDGRRRIQGYVTEVITDLAIDWLENGRPKDKPFLLMCQHKAPHRNWMPGPNELDLFSDVQIPEPPTLFDDYSGRSKAARMQEMTIAHHMTMGYDLQCLLDEDEWLADGWRADRKRMTPEQRERFEAAFAKENAELKAAGLEGESLVRWKYQRFVKNYLRCVVGVDKSVGRLLEWLGEHHLLENTIVVYSSDQGFYLGEHGWFDKRWMYEESFRMPLLMRWPKRIAPGTVTDALVQNIDYAPTFLDLAGVSVPGEIQGRSLVPLFDGKTPDDWRKSLYYHFYESKGWHKVPAHEGVRTARYTLMHFYEPEVAAWELYDLEKDPREMKSVAGDPAYADVEKQLREELARLKEKFGT